VFVWFAFLDAPLLVFSPVFARLGSVAPLAQFGVFGSALWFLIPWSTDTVITRVFPSVTRVTRGIIIGTIVALIAIVFVPIAFFSTGLLVRGERPAELKKTINKASSGFLTVRTIYRDRAMVRISAITRRRCRLGAGAEILLYLPWGVAFLDERYQERHRIIFSRPPYMTIEAMATDSASSCRYLAYRFFEKVQLFDETGKGTMLWQRGRDDGGSGPIDERASATSTVTAWRRSSFFSGMEKVSSLSTETAT
jgi:hypothetical protein